jgi:hypothetical protein
MILFAAVESSVTAAGVIGSLSWHRAWSVRVRVLASQQWGRGQLFVPKPTQDVDTPRSDPL